MCYINYYDSPIGRLTLVSDGESLVELCFEKQRYLINDKNALKIKSLSVFDETQRWLDMYFSGKTPDFSPKLLLSGSDFRKRVCEIMLNISFGKSVSYLDIAKQIAIERGIKSMSAQAVGGAVGNNPLAIIVPCHRVLGKNGNLTGYGGGLDKKIWLLNHEGIAFKI